MIRLLDSGLQNPFAELMVLLIGPGLRESDKPISRELHLIYPPPYALKLSALTVSTGLVVPGPNELLRAWIVMQLV